MRRPCDDAHQWARTGGAITGAPESYGRVSPTADGRGLIYGDIEDRTLVKTGRRTGKPVRRPPIMG